MFSEKTFIFGFLPFSSVRVFSLIFNFNFNFMNINFEDIEININNISNSEGDHDKLINGDIQLRED